MNLKKAKDLTDQEKEAFAEIFYAEVSFDDRESPNPWGCPWFYMGNQVLKGATISEMVENFLEELRKDEDFRNLEDRLA